MFLVAGIPTKNEEWIIGKTLSVLIKFCDKVVILDDNSIDKTEEICRSFENVKFIKRKLTNNIIDTGMSALGKKELLNHISKYNPKYILMLDADEIPTPSFIEFLKNIDTTVSAWKIRMINLYSDDKHYRVDSFKTLSGININWNPFSNNAWMKTVLFKFENSYNYTYNFNNIIGGVSKYHPAPENLKGTIVETDEFYIIHYGKLNKTYTSGEKDKLYAEIETKVGRGTYKERLQHHYLCRTGSGPNGPEYEKCPREWFWT